MVLNVEITCPNCGSKKCLYGKVKPWDSDDVFRGIFCPSHIKEHGWITLDIPKVALEDKEKFFGCYECGHLWSKLKLNQFQQVIEECNWQGGVQKPPKSRRSYFWIISWLMFCGLGVSILYFKYF